MTLLSREEVIQIASLSGLHLSDSSIPEFQKDIETVLEHVATLNQLDTEGVKPTYQVNNLQNVWRQDVVDQPLEGSDLVALAPEHGSDNTVTVPKVL